MVGILDMRLLPLLLATLTLKASAELPVMSDDTRWLGYFVGWEQKDYDWGFGDDGVVKIHHLIKGKPGSHKDFVVSFIVREQIKGKWVSRRILDEGGLESNDQPGLDSKKPVTVTMTVTGGTKIELVQALSRGRMLVKPTLIEKTTENPIQFVVKARIPDLFRHMKEDLTEKEIKKLMRSDYIEGKRKKDGKKVKVKLYEKEIDLSDEKHFEEGATFVEYSSKKIEGKSFTMQQGSDDVGHFKVSTGSNLYSKVEFEWIADMEKLGEKDSYVSIAID